MLALGTGLCGCMTQERRTESVSLAASQATANRARSLNSERRSVEGQLPDVVEPLEYRIRLRIDPRRARFSGQAEVRIRLRQRTKRIVFHADDMAIRSAHVVLASGDKVRARITSQTPAKGVVERVAHVSQWLGPGDVTLLFRYDAPFNTKLGGLYRAKVRVGGTQKWFAYTQFEAADARKAFPCFDEPRWKVPYEVTLEIPSEMRAFANSPERQRRTRNGWTTVGFARTKPLPTYLVAFVVGDFEYRKHASSSLTLGGVVVRGKGDQVERSLAIAAEQLQLLEGYFGVPYPYSKLDLVGVVDFGAGAMENAGLITFREEALLHDEKNTSLAAMKRISGTIAHELAHQWFGNLVTMAWWDDLWLNEAFATWMGTKIVQRWRPGYEAQRGLLQWRNSVFDTDALAASKPVRQPVRTVAEAEQAFNPLTYGKGATVLGMIENWTGAQRFRDGIRKYIRRHRWGNARARDLFAALEEATAKPVGSVARSFVDRSGVPMVEAAVRCNRSHGSQVRLAQSRYRPLGARSERGFPKGTPWRIPVCVKFLSSNSAQEPKRRWISRCVLISKATGVIDLPTECPNVIYPNAEERGYYRWSVDADMLERLINARQLLSPDEQMALLEQSWAAVAAGKIKPSVYVQALRAFKGSDERIVVAELIHGLYRIARVFSGKSNSQLQKLSRELLTPIARKLGWRAKRGESLDQQLLRGEVLFALGDLGRSSWVRLRALDVARRYLNRSSTVDANIAPVALKLAASFGGISVADLRRALQRAASPGERINALTALGNVPPGKSLNAALGLMLTDLVRAQDMYYLFGPGIRRELTRLQSFRFIRDHYDEIVTRLPNMGWRSAARLPALVQNFCRVSERDQVKRFFSTKVTANNRVYYEQGLERAEQCLALRKWGLESALKSLSNVN